jgi:arginine deiminase
MSTLEQRIEAGGRARDVLENSAYTEAYQAIEQELINEWISSPARDAQGREKLWTYLQMLRRVQSQLAQTMESGQLARVDLQHKRSLMDRARESLRWSSDD